MDYLEHDGVKGMSWGQRNFQNKDGTWTPLGLMRRRKMAKQKSKQEGEQETVEQKKERLRKSTNIKELYENRHLLTTEEINERINRINTEARLGQMLASTKTTAEQRIDKVISVGKKMSDAYNFVSKDPMMKDLGKKLGIMPDGPEFEAKTFEYIYNNRRKMTNQQLKDAAERTRNESIIRRYVEEERQRQQNNP